MTATAEEFADAAETFTLLCEEGSEVALPWLESLYRELTRLMAEVCRLDDRSPEEPAEERGVDVSQGEWEAVHATALSLIPTRNYSFVWADGSRSTGDTAEDVANIYRVLKDGLSLWKQGDDAAREAASSCWRAGYLSHWGTCASGLLYALQPVVRRAGIATVALLDGETEFLEQVLSRRPGWEQHLSRLPAPPDDRWTIQLAVPPPGGDELLTLVFWLSDGDPSVAFGPWHTHAESVEEIWPYVDAIEQDRIVLVTDLGGPYDGTTVSIDLREDDALLEHLTCSDGPPRVQIRSFGGTADGEVP